MERQYFFGIAVLLVTAYVGFLAIQVILKRDEPVFSLANLRVLPAVLFSMVGLAFLVELGWAFIFGGTAEFGKIQNGTYFVGSQGAYTEVSETVFRVSLWYARIIKALALIAGSALLVQVLYWACKKKPITHDESGVGDKSSPSSENNTTD